MDSTVYSGMPIVLAWDSIDELAGILPGRLRVVKMSFTADRAAKIVDGAEFPPSDILLAVARDAAEKAALAEFFASRAKPAPPIVTGSEPLALAREIVAALSESLEKAAIREAALRESLLSLREEAEEMRAVYSRLRREMAKSLSSTALEVAWENPPLDADATLDFSGAFEFVVRTPVETYGMASISVHIARYRLEPTERLEIRLIAEEKNRVLGAWIAPAAAMPANSDWLVLDLPISLTTAQQTAIVAFKGRLAPTSLLSFSKGALPDNQDGSPAPAMRIQRASSPRATPSPLWSWELTGKDAHFGKTSKTAPAAIPEQNWLAAHLLGPAKLLQPSHGVVRVRMGGARAAMLVFPHVPLANFVALTARLQLRSGASGEVVAAIALLPNDLTLGDDLAAAVEAATLWSPVETVEGRPFIATLPLPPDGPSASHVALALRHMSPHQEDFAVIDCDSLWLLPGEPTAAASQAALFVTPAAPVLSGADYESVVLDQLFANETYRHLDLSIKGLVEGDATWNRVKFKLTEFKGRPRLEFRSGSGWPEYFRIFPGTESDKFGQIYRIGGPQISGPQALAEAIKSLPEEKDRRLLAAIDAVLVNIVQTLSTKGALQPSDATLWLDIARRMRAVAADDRA